MSIRSRKKPTRISGFRSYYRTPAWYARREAVRRRAQGRCEFCRFRRLEHVHHRTYIHFGQEPLSDLMACCRLCHLAIHRRGPQGTCAAGSLMAQGDRGLGYSPLWSTYLLTCKGAYHERGTARRIA
jgi:5-methylcytosine-specific restriction endonuclease McrA